MLWVIQSLISVKSRLKLLENIIRLFVNVVFKQDETAELKQLKERVEHLEERARFKKIKEVPRFSNGKIKRSFNDLVVSLIRIPANILLLPQQLAMNSVKFYQLKC